MTLQRTVCALALQFLTVVCCCTAAEKSQHDDDRSDYRWFSIPVEVSNLGNDAQFVPIRAHIDFSDLVNKLGASGVVDEHSLRLYRIAASGRLELPVQFTPDPQPRPNQPPKLPDTPASVSYLGEYRAGTTPPQLKVAGELTWIAQADGKGSANYRLEFGILKDGVAVQAPYPPQDLKVFDAQGKATPIRHFPRMQIRPDRPIGGHVDILDDNHLITSYHLGPASPQQEGGHPQFRRPVLYPVLGPDDLPLTDFGKPHDPTGSHAHHYSLWVAHEKVDGVDFWSEKGGMIVGDALQQSESGPVFCRLVENLRWMDGQKELMRERRHLTVYHTPDAYRILDFELELTPPGTGEVTLGKTTFGFLAVRVAQSMTVFDGGGEILNSEGKRNERGAHLQHANWIDLSGPVAEGKWAGIAIFDHPQNPHHPTTFHCRNDGWACASFNADEPYTINAGQSLHLRYRVLLHRGNASDGQVAQRYREYSAVSQVRLGQVIAMEGK